MRVKCYKERVSAIALEYGLEEKDIIDIFIKLTAPKVKIDEDAGAIIYKSKDWDITIKYKKENNNILISADTLIDALGWKERYRLYEYLRNYKTRQCHKRDIFIHVLCSEILKIKKPDLLR